MTGAEELPGLAARLRAAPERGPDDWLDARGHFLAIHDVYAAECGEDKGLHPALVLHCAWRMESFAQDLRDLRPGDADEGLRDLCMRILCGVESAVADGEHRRWAHTDDDLPEPSGVEQRDDASFEECGTWDMDNRRAQLAAVAELVAQDAATHQQGSIWVRSRDRFLRFYAGWRRPGLHPAVGWYYASEMSHCVDVMSRYAHHSDLSRKFHDRIQEMLWRTVEDADWDMSDTSGIELTFQCAAGNLCEHCRDATEAGERPATAPGHHE